ncbi:MAG: hypothetical protein ACPGWR_32810, partial [Ardenticatenaceae bacterium]
MALFVIPSPERSKVPYESRLYRPEIRKELRFSQNNKLDLRAIYYSSAEVFHQFFTCPAEQ